MASKKNKNRKSKRNKKNKSNRRKSNKNKSNRKTKTTRYRTRKTKVGKIGGVKLKMDFISSNIQNEKSEKSRINYVLEIVKDGTILVTDGVLSPNEELDLIRETMRRVDSGFPGIEVCSLRRETEGYQKVLEQLSEQKHRLEKFFSMVRGRGSPKMNLKYGMTLIGPSRLIKEIKKNPDSFSVFAEA